MGRYRFQLGHSELLHPDIRSQMVSIQRRVRNALEDISSLWKRGSLGEPGPHYRSLRMDWVNRLETSTVGIRLICHDTDEKT
jgi:hypothetical protein